jgi:hypothetical protein
MTDNNGTLRKDVALFALSKPSADGATCITEVQVLSLMARGIFNILNTS